MTSHELLSIGNLRPGLHLKTQTPCISLGMGRPVRLENSQLWDELS